VYDGPVTSNGIILIKKFQE